MDGVFKFIFLPRRAVLASEGNRSSHMGEERRQQHHPRDPDTRTVQRTVEELCVFIECLAADIDEQVSRKVAGEEKHEDNAGDGDDVFFPNRGGPEGGKTSV